MVSSVTLPVYLVTIFVSPRSRVTVKETSSFLNVPPSILLSPPPLPPPFPPPLPPPNPPDTVPVSLSPSSFSFIVLSTSLPSLPNFDFHVHVPVGSAAYAMPNRPTRKAANANFFIGHLPHCGRRDGRPSPERGSRPRNCCSRMQVTDQPYS